MAVDSLDSHTLSITLTKPSNYIYLAGQYTHWTVLHENPDNRGLSREFSFASAPEESSIRFLTRIPDRCSTYKQAIKKMRLGQITYVTPAQGKFLLPSDSTKSIVWLAGGVGIAPFRSFTKHMELTGKSFAKINLFFSNPDEFFPYLSDVSAVSPKLTITRQGPVGWNGNYGHFTSDLISKNISNPQEAMYYICGHQQMALSVLKLLVSDLKVSRLQINLDLFTGY